MTWILCDSSPDTRFLADTERGTMFQITARGAKWGEQHDEALARMKAADDLYAAVKVALDYWDPGGLLRGGMYADVIHQMRAAVARVEGGPYE